MGNWFGSLSLAYKYTVVFLSLLAFTIIAGLLKVLYNRRKLKQHTKEQKVEEGVREDQVELNHREKDEGDLFGIRAIEAGFFGGVSQSRPTSRAASRAGSYVDSPAMSSNTLVGSSNSHHKLMNQSMNSSVTTLPLAHTTDRNSPTPHRKSPPTIRLAPSEAELTGRHNLDAQVNMGLAVPPSPVHARGPNSPTFGGSDSGESDGNPSPRSANFNHYAPVPPQIPMPPGLQVSVHPADNPHQSQAASLNNFSPSQSAPSSPGHPPSGNLPAVPPRARDEQPRSFSPYSDRNDNHARSESPVVKIQQLTHEPEPSPLILQPQTYKPHQQYKAFQSQPNHQRDESETSVYSNQHKANAGHQHKQSNSTDLSYNFSLTDNSNRTSAALTISTTKEPSRRLSASSSLNVPGSSQNATGQQPHDPRLSEFYDAYYRHSQIGVPAKDSSKRPNQLNLTGATIEEVPSPIPSPHPEEPLVKQHPGMAM